MTRDATTSSSTTQRSVGVATLRLAVLLGAGLASAAVAQAPSRSGLPAFDRAEVAACAASPEWTGWSIRVALVTYGDGAWALALDAPDLPRGLLRRARECLQNAVLDQDDLAAPRRAAVYVRTVRGPLPPSDRVAEIEARFEANRAAISDCALGALLVGAYRETTHLDFRLLKTARLTVETKDTTEAATAVAECTRRAMGAFAPGSASLGVVVTLDGVGRVTRPDGRAGAICGWGQRRTDRFGLPEPMPCADGLQCCAAGGAAGSDSACFKGPCPMFP